MSKRDEYIEHLKAQLDKLNTEIDQLEARTHEVSAEVQNNIREQLEHARTKREELHGRLAEIREASGDAWEDIRDGADEALATMKAAFAKARSHFHGKD